MSRRTRNREFLKHSRLLFTSYAFIKGQADEIECCGGFSDRALEEAINGLHISEGDYAHSEDLASITAKEKIEINRLGERSVDILQQSIVCFTQIQNFINEREKTELGFHNKLRGFFYAEYKRLLKEGKVGDTLFEHLVKSVRSKIAPIKVAHMATIAPIVTYLFVICDLFARTEEERGNVAAK